VFKRVLIANRGEIALRVLRACHELDIEVVAVYSEADRDSLHVRLADQAVCIGPGSSSASYLNVHNILSAAILTGSEAIHPGYGYLAEQASFVEICESHDIKFIGPSAEAIQKMGDKAEAKSLMMAAGLPVIPGSETPLADEQEALKIANSLGYPLMLKAVAGGGGKGMRIINNEEALLKLFPAACAEAEAAFGDGRVYLEKLLISPRHIEIQIVADEYGNVVHLGERECSIQRKHQKMVEEALAVCIDSQTREEMGRVAIQGAKAANYSGVGTIEFLLDEDGSFYFMEMNTRIQVEHPVTEMVTGRDLIKEQIKIATGDTLSFGQEEVTFNGHAIECRINAEDPEAGYRPSPGTIEFYHQPGGPGVRVDSLAYSGSVISPYYDSMIAKVICHGSNRDEAIQRMQAVLDEMIIEGIKTNLDFQKEIIASPAFIKGDVSTDFIEKNRFKD
jgi:acetyl-CoA carboxylase biotin carboxylase subunit